jgi:hypothetical protein
MICLIQLAVMTRNASGTRHTALKLDGGGLLKRLFIVRHDSRGHPTKITLRDDLDAFEGPRLFAFHRSKPVRGWLRWFFPGFISTLINQAAQFRTLIVTVLSSTWFKSIVTSVTGNH